MSVDENCGNHGEKPLLDIRGLSRGFPSGQRQIQVLRDVNLSISRGTSISIRGESGCGKTTLLNLMAGLDRADAGTIRWCGDPLPAAGSAALSRWRGRHIGMVFQAYYLIPELSALENVVLASRIVRSLPLNLARSRAVELLQRLGLGDRLDSCPLVLSGGERQRVAIARAMINGPDLILADEPTGNLDERSSRSVMEALLELTQCSTSTLVLVTHHPVYAAQARFRYELSGGVLTSVE